MEKYKILAAALALREFTVEEISALSGVKDRTVRSTLQRNPQLVRRADPMSDHADDVSLRRGRGRPASRWVVVDFDHIRRLVDDVGSLPKFEPSRTDLDPEDSRSVAVTVAEDALAQVSEEPDPLVRERLISSARSSLFFAESGEPSRNLPWWELEDSTFAARARGVDALATLASRARDDHSLTADELSEAARNIAAAMQAVPDGAEATYFVPFSQILAQSGKFAPMYALCSLGQEPVYQLTDDWTEVKFGGLGVRGCRVLTQDWAEPFVEVSASMPFVVASRTLNAEVGQMIEVTKNAPRPAFVLGPPTEGHLIRKSGLAGASFIAIEEPLGADRQYAIESVVALIDRFSIGR